MRLSPSIYIFMLPGVMGAEKLNLNCFGANCVCLSNFSHVSLIMIHM